ncbi:MAG TPA: 5-(carboxyamino)imidazole ribonucleotide mutase [Bryobacteraceae bacterium]|nr:5-(carboxyamino)imidazole ribonucleotide mutase [Bryobacteraceae bacterium]
MANQVSRSRKASKTGKDTVTAPLVGIIMGSKSDWDTMKAASDIFKEFGIPHECRVISAHRTPELLMEFTATAEERGIEVIIAGAGGAAHLAGVTAAHTVLPVLGVPIESKLNGLDSLLSTVQMPGGIPVGTLAIGSAGAKNAALFAIAIMGTKRARFREKLREYRAKMKRKLAEETLP